MTKQEIIERMTSEVQVLRNLAKDNAGKYVNTTSLGHVKVEKGYGLNGTDYSFAFSHALIFDTEKDAYNAGDFYLTSTSKGKKITVYVSSARADEFFNNEADILQSSLNWLNSQGMDK